MGIKERLLVFIKYKELSKYAFEKSIGVSNGFINSIKKSVGSDKLDGISDVYPELNINWLLTGIGAMLNPQNGKLAKDNIFYLPYVSVVEYGNYIEKYNDDSYIQSLPQLVVKHIPLNPDTVKYAFEVADDSMLDEKNRYSFAKGDVVFADNIGQDYSRIEEGKTYVVVLKNGIRICFCEIIDNDKILLSSRSKALYPDRTIGKDEASQIFFVIGGSFSR
ncbi:S24 family peptidase [Dysgonomonas sp.]